MLTRHLLAAGLVLAASATLVRAQDDAARAVVLKAIAAHGGKETLAKYPAAIVKFKGNMTIMGVEAKLEGDIAFALPDKMRNVMQINVNNMNVDVVQVFDGKKLFVKAAGQVIPLNDPKIIEETKESIYVEKVASLYDLDDKAYKLSPLGEAQVNGKDAIGVRVSREGRRDVNLYFDKKSSMLVKYEFRGRDPINMMEVTQEKVLSDYKAIQGVQTPTRIAVSFDGNRAIEMEITEVSYLEALDDSTFAKP